MRLVGSLLIFFFIILAGSNDVWGQASVVTGSVATVKTTYVPGAGYNRIVVVAVTREQSPVGTVSSVLYGAQNLTFVHFAVSGGLRTEIWYMTEAQIRAGGYCGAAFTVNWSTALTGTEIFAVMTIKDVDQTTPVAGAVGVGFNGAGIGANTTIATGNMTGPGVDDIVLYASSCSNNRTHTAAAGYTERTDQVVATAAGQATATKAITVAATENPTATWTTPNSSLINVGVVFNGITAISTTSTYTFYSLATGAWDANTTWSLTETGSSGAVASGLWPRRTDNVIIKSGHTVTIDALDDNKTCGVSPNSLLIANVGSGGGGAVFDNSSSALFYHSGNITVRGTLYQSNGGMNMMTSGTTIVDPSGTLTVNQDFYNIGYFEVQSGGAFSTLGNFVISGTSTSLINNNITIGDDFGIDFTSATICGSGVASLNLGPGSAIVYTNPATAATHAAQMCTAFVVACPGGGCSNFPVTGTGTTIVGNSGPAGVGASVNNRLWLRSTDISQADNTAVATWTDASGNGLNATQGTAGLQPRFFTNVVNSTIPAVRFDGASTDYLIVGQSALLDFTPRTDVHTYFSAVNVATGASGTVICRALSGARQWQYTLDLTTPNRFGYFRGGDFSAGSQVATNAWKIPAAIVGTNATTGFTGFANGTADVAAASVGTATAAATDVLVGARRNSDNTDAAFYLTGDIGEIILYDVQLSTVHRVLIENYLAAKFNITGLGTEAYTADGSGYDFDVAGIGQAGGVAHRDAKGPGIVRMWNPSGLADNEYLMWGHDNATLVSASTDVDGAVIDERLTRIWSLTMTGDVGTVSVSFDISALGSGYEATNLRLLIDRDANFATNDVTPIVGSLSSSVLTFTGVDFNTGDRFTLGNTTATMPLPIELVDFRAVPDRDVVNLSWTTLSERNNDFFTVERSTDGEAWTDVTIVKGAGTTSSTRKYSAIDDGAQNGVSYYRLRQTDFNGSFKYSDVRRVELEGIIRLTIFPNPSKGSYTITGSDDLTLANVQMLDVLGRPVAVTVTKQLDAVSIDPLDVAPGVYFIRVATDSWARTVRVVRE